jgi:hypothetical protein
MFFLKVEDKQGNLVKNFDKILSINLKQQEGFLPIAQLCVPKDANLHEWISHEYTYSLVEETPQERYILLRGRYVGQTPKGLHSVSIALIPRMPSEQEIQQLLDPYLHEHDALFTHTEDSGFNYPIETIPFVLDFDRSRQRYGMNNVFEGRRGIALRNLPKEGIFHVDITRSPYGSIRLKLEMNWSRSSLELFDLGELIQQGVGPIHTLTPQSIQEAWPKPGQPLCRGVFTVISASLPITGQEESSVSSLDSHTGEKERMPVSVAMVKPELILSYEKSFHYHETFETDVLLAPQSPSGPVVRQNFRLNALSEKVGEQDKAFFEGVRGKMAIHHAMKMAKMKLLASHRNRRLTLSVPYEEACHISTFDWIVVEDPRLLKGKFEGKVSSYTMHIEGEARYVTVSLSACPSSIYVWLEKMSESLESVEGLSVQLTKTNEPQEGMKDFIADVSIDHGAQEQIEDAEQSGDLKVNATVVKVHLNSQALVRNRTIRRCFSLS